MSQDPAPAAKQSSRLLIRNIGLLLTGDIQNPISDADTILSVDGRITAVDMFVVNENGPYEPSGDTAASGRMVSLLFQPQAMRWRGVSVLTNTPPRRAQSQPGGMQGIVLIEPIIAKPTMKPTKLATENVRLANRWIGSTGSTARRSTATKTTTRRAPATPKMLYNPETRVL